MAIFMLVINSNDKKIMLEKKHYIYYLIWALLNSKSKVNAMIFDCNQELGLKIQKTNIKAQKIDGSTLKIFKIMIADFQMQDKADKPKYLKRHF